MDTTIRLLPEAEDGHQRFVDPPQLLGADMAHQCSETPRVDCTDLLDQHARRLIIHRDFGPEGCCTSTTRGWRNENHGAREQSVGLNQDAIPSPLLLVAATTGHAQNEHVTAAHASSP